MRAECQQNASFWSFVCGSPRMRGIGARADQWFFEYYPWLEKHIPFESLRGKKVIEIGIGSGSVAKRLAGLCDFTAMDVAQETLDPLPYCTKVKGSVLDAPFPDRTFDYVVCIGCVHHTGDPPRALSEIHRILKPGGGCTTMVYHKGSGRQEIARLWDKDPCGNGPPFTEWFTVDEYAQLLTNSGFTNVTVTPENFRAGGDKCGLNLYATATA